MRGSKTHHTSAALERLYLPRAEGGRGLQGVELMWEREAIGAAVCHANSQDRQVQMALHLERTIGAMGKYSFLWQAEETANAYGIDPRQTYATPREATRDVARRQEGRDEEPMAWEAYPWVRQASLRAKS